ncbi:hypothetical protein [Hymenobacter arizonensis]|uniref:Uncharacterized protein n=1 Tax=Hymenobacter arizonensis TaxID=1227077 RepID=A0A1I5Z9H3_HYMAR|nr:hypothetical protein [Hymenobacter arizonensis]SFQ52767.1 hypothetical protein SAMN04515668_2814 [Hymenobacter arizonensis]
MKHFYRSLASLLLLASGNVAAQQPAAGPLQTAQTISLGEHTMLAGTLVLPNHNTVLLLTDGVSFDITAQCLAPDGHTLWKTTLNRFQRPTQGFSLELQKIAIGREARENKEVQKEKLAAALYPVNVVTDGNTVVLAERLSESWFKKFNHDKSFKLKNDHMFVQRLDEQGRLTKHQFEPRPEAELKKVEVRTLGRYAEANGYVEVVRETNKREETLVFALLHFDFNTKTLRREPIDMPATPEHITGLNHYRHWYQEWAYLGHRPNQTYFCRRTLVTGAPKEKPGKQPLIYQVYITDDQGKATGGFSTTLALNKGTRPMYSGPMPSPGELNHIPLYFEVAQGKNRNVTYDEWETSTGGMGSFYLDHATGDVLIYGEYGEGEIPEMTNDDLKGFFVRRYAPDGRAVAQVQNAYSEAMRAKKKNASFRGGYYRQTRFHVDPISGQTQFSFSPLRVYGNSEDFDLFMDRDFKPLRYDYLPGKDKDERTYTSVQYAQPFKLTSTYDGTDDIRLYEHADKTDPAVYAALEKKRRTAPADAHDYWFHLSPTGATSGLVVEQKKPLGGSLQVYTFQ